MTRNFNRHHKSIGVGLLFALMFGCASIVEAMELSAEQHYTKGVLLLSQNDGSGETSITHDGLLASIAELEAALAMALTPSKDARLALSKAYYICMSIADSTKASPSNVREKAAMECRKKGEALIKHLDDEYPEDPQVLELFANLSVFNRERQLSIYERLVKVSPDNANAHESVASLYRERNRNAEGVAHYREALRLQSDPQRAATIAHNLHEIFSEMGCSLNGFKEISDKIGGMYAPFPSEDNKAKESFAATFLPLKKLLLKKLDENPCARLDVPVSRPQSTSMPSY